MFVIVRFADFNSGADIFGVVNAANDAKDIPLGHEGVGVLIRTGLEMDGFDVGAEVVFVGGGTYGKYTRVEAKRYFRIKRGKEKKGGEEKQEPL